MIVGIRAALLIANQREYKQQAPPLPSLTEVLPSMSELRSKGVLSTQFLTDAAAHDAGLYSYLQPLRSSLARILSVLDMSVGRPLNIMQQGDPEVQAAMKREDRKCLLSLYRNAIVAIPRFIDVHQFDALPLLFWANIHMDVELRKLASVVLQCLLRNHKHLRASILQRFAAFVVNNVSFGSPAALDHCLRIIVFLLRQWHRTARQERNSDDEDVEAGAAAIRVYGSEVVSSQVKFKICRRAIACCQVVPAVTTMPRSVAMLFKAGRILISSYSPPLNFLSSLGRYP